MKPKALETINGSIIPVGAILITLGMALIFTFLFQLMGMFLVSVATGIPFIEMGSVMTNPEGGQSRYILLFVQACASFGGFIVTSVVYLKWISRTPLSAVLPKNRVKMPAVVITILVTLVFMLPNSQIIEWNMNIDLPDGPFENAVRKMEDTAMELTMFLTQIDTFGYYLMAMFVIAVIPGIGEELLFRGLLQNMIHRWSNNMHIGIWLAAILFGLFHFQFFGLIPRILLGALFGYLYVWSGSLIYPMIAHFVNNGFQVTMIYVMSLRGETYDLETESSAPWYLALLGVVALVFLLRFFSGQFKYTE